MMVVSSAVKCKALLSLGHTIINHKVTLTSDAGPTQYVISL